MAVCADIGEQGRYSLKVDGHLVNQNLFQNLKETHYFGPETHKRQEKGFYLQDRTGLLSLQDQHMLMSLSPNLNVVLDKVRGEELYRIF